ncbi:ABC transporter ATP-binding protein [Pseudodesulfovibrio alkaliphilus]|nr:ABC transporter ATP-binding protein [Pseudodesulfovibrio alkaliphilus]
MKLPYAATWLSELHPDGMRQLCVGTILAVLGAVLLPVPIFMGWLVLKHFLAEGTATGLPAIPCLIALAAVIASSVCRIASAVLSHKAAFSLSSAISAAVLDHVGKLPLHWFSGRSTGELKKMLTHDVSQMEDFIAHNITDFVASLVLPVICIIALFFVSWPMALLLLAIVATAIGIHASSIRNAQKTDLYDRYARSMSLLHADAVEFVQGMPDIKIFNRSAESFSRMQSAIDQFRTMQVEMRDAFKYRWTAFLTVTTFPFVLLALSGAALHLANAIPLEKIMLFLMLGIIIFAPLNRLVRFTSSLFKAISGYMALRQLMNVPAQQAGLRKHSEIESADLEVNGLRVSYEGKTILNDVSFRIEPGTVTAIVGPSGSGKSTLAAVIAGMEEAESGRISIGGIALEDFSYPELSKSMAVVFQQPFIFSGTVAENIRLGSDQAGDKAVRDAARMAHCDHFIETLPRGYDTLIGAGQEVHLSAGQRQRIALARMALKNAPVVLLDEATAFADPESEAEIQQGLSALLSDKTVLVIAHRLPSIARSNCILVMENGRICERGRHEELLAAKGTYARMWEAYASARSWRIATLPTGPNHGKEGAAVC